MLQSTAYVKIFFFVSCMNISCKNIFPVYYKRLRWVSISRAVSSKNRWKECNIHYLKECFKQGKEPKVYAK